MHEPYHQGRHQLATLQHKDPVQATKERLFVYHTTPHSMTEKTPFELGRVAKTKLYTLGWKVSSKFQKIQRLERSKQAKYKAYHNQKQRVKTPDIKPGDFVKIKNPRHVHKGEMRYSPPQKVISVKGSCIVLENGKRWNVERLAKVQNSKVTSSLEHAKVDSESDFTFMDLNVESQLEIVRANVQEAGRAPPIQDPVRRSAREIILWHSTGKGCSEGEFPCALC